MPTATFPQGSIDYRVAGPADAAGPVVFVHGFLVNGELWTGVADLLAARGVRSYSPDLPLGSHRSAMNPEADQSPEGVARLVLAFLDHLDLRDVTLVGNDTGGAIVQFAIDRDLDQDSEHGGSRIGRVVLTNCDAFEQFPPRRFKLLFKIGRSPRRALALLLPTRWTPIRHSPLGFGPLASKPLDAALTRRWVEPCLTDRAVRRDTARFLRNVRPKDLLAVSNRLGRFTKPVRLVWGTDDTAFTIKLAQRLAAVLPNATIVEVPGSKTFVSLDAPERLADEILAAADVGTPADLGTLSSRGS